MMVRVVVRMAGIAALSSALLAAVSLPAAARVAYGLDDPALAARIGAADALHAFSVDALWRTARAANPKAARTATLETLVAERLLAAAARREWGEAVLLTGQGVAFTHDVALDDQQAALLRNLYRQELEQALAVLPGASLDGLIVSETPLTAALQDAVLGKPGALRLDYSLNRVQQEQARATPVLIYRGADGAPVTLSLWDIYSRQNVQGRAALHHRQPGALAQQARQVLATLYVLDWARQRFGAEAMADLRRVLSDQQVVLAVQRLHGIGADTDSGSALLDRLAAQASQEAIASYYQQHRADFTRIEKVRARHVRLVDEQVAQSVYTALRQGGDMAALARKHSVAADASSGGDLGWIAHEGKPSWLAQLAYAQPEGQPSRPIRAPVGPHDKAYWEIVLVEQRVMGVQPVEAESVRYVASRAIARAAAIAQLTALRARVVREAEIDVNRALLDQPVQVLEPGA